MRNKDYFKFKQFSIFQGNSAMKVSTDACIFGIQSARHFKNFTSKKVLDVGTGTGLLSFIWHQENPHFDIDAVEIDKDAFTDCLRNIEENYIKMITAINVDFLEFQSEKRFDIIVSNPPFFLHSLKNNLHKKSKARHADVHLDPTDFFAHSYNLLNDDGYLIALYPYSMSELIENIASKIGFQLDKKINIKSFQDSTPHCRIFFWKKDAKAIEDFEEDFIIYQEEKKYSQQAIELFKDYYLAL